MIWVVLFDQKWFNYRLKNLRTWRRAFQCYSTERVLETTCHSKWDWVPERPSPIWSWAEMGNWGEKNLLKFIDLNLFTISEGPASWGFKLRNKRAEILVFILISLWDSPSPSTQDTFISCEVGNTNTSLTELTPFLSIHQLKHLLGQQWGRGHCHLWGSTGTIWEWMK